MGPTHPDTLTSVQNLAACLSALGRHAEAEPLYRRALEARVRVRCWRAGRCPCTGCHRWASTMATDAWLCLAAPDTARA